MQKIVYKLLTCIILMNILFQFNYSSIIYAVTSATTVTQSTTSGTTASTTEETIDKWNMDFEDWEKILRIECRDISALEISEVLRNNHIFATELE